MVKIEDRMQCKECKLWIRNAYTDEITIYGTCTIDGKITTEYYICDYNSKDKEIK
jgi:hypothetical protein